jgi:hypothetical protein
MGSVTSGLPGGIALELARLAQASVFVETGTFQGRSALWASKPFDAVYTIEKSDALYALHEEGLVQLPGVKPLHGDSRAVLPGVLAELGARSALFWLDGHWSGEGTAGADDECPLLGELACLSGRERDLILIDDARLFLGAPPRPYRPAAWPTIADILDALPGTRSRWFIQIVDDVIFCVPAQDAALKQRLIEYAQDRADLQWQKFLAAQAAPAREDGWRGILSSAKRRAK